MRLAGQHEALGDLARLERVVLVHPHLALEHPGPAGAADAALAGVRQVGARGEAGLRFATPSQTNLDRNTVDMDRERAAFADNAIHYEATLRFINGSVRTMLSAITGQ